MKKLISLGVLILFLASCSFQLEKRRYRPGFYLSINNPKLAKHNQESTVKTPILPPDGDLRAKQVSAPNTVTAFSTQPTSQIIQSPSSQITARQNQNKKQQEFQLNRNEINYLKHTPEISSDVESKSSSRNSDALFYSLSLLVAAITAISFKSLMMQSKKIGVWALNNRKFTRAIHFGLQSLLATSGYYLGGVLNREGITLSNNTTVALAAIGSTVLLTYPFRKVKTGVFRNTYAKQKWFSLALALTGLLLFVNLGNRFASEKYLSEKYEKASLTDVEILKHTVSTITDVDTKPENEMSDSTRIALAVLVIILCVAACMLIAALSCALFCSGQGVIGALLLIVAAPLLIIGTVRLTQKLLNPIRERKRNEKRSYGY